MARDFFRRAQRTDRDKKMFCVLRSSLLQEIENVRKHTGISGKNTVRGTFGKCRCKSESWLLTVFPVVDLERQMEDVGSASAPETEPGRSLEQEIRSPLCVLSFSVRLLSGRDFGGSVPEQPRPPVIGEILSATLHATHISLRGSPSFPVF